MSVKDIETERLWGEMKRKNPSLYDSEHPAPLIEPHAKKREARKVYSDSVDDYPPEDDFVELDTAESDSSTSVHPQVEMVTLEDGTQELYEEEWQREREEASYHYDYDIDEYVDSSGNRAPWC